MLQINLIVIDKSVWQHSIEMLIILFHTDHQVDQQAAAAVLIGAVVDSVLIDRGG